MKVRNDVAAGYLNGLEPLLDTKGKLGYCVARNNRLLVTELREYILMRDGLIAKYGDGKSISPTMPGWEAFAKEMSDVDVIERDYDFEKITWQEASEQLTARQMLAIDWMLED